MIPALLAITWLVVAVVRIEQLSRQHTNTSVVAQFWSISTLTLLALLYLVYAGIRRGTTTRRLVDDAYRRVSRLEQITDVGLSELPTDELLTTLIGRICDGLGADAGMLLLTAADGSGSLEVRATCGLAADVPPGYRVAPGVGLAGRVAHHRSAMAIEDLSTATFAVHPIRDMLASAAGAPLLTNGRVAGVLVIATTAPHRYDDEDIKLLQLAADRCARSIEANRLREAEHRLNLGTEHARRHLRLLVDASRILQETVSDYETGLVRLVELASRDFAGFGAVYLAEGGENLALLVAQHAAPGSEAVEAFRSLPADALAPVREAMATGRSRLAKDPGGDLFGRALAAMDVSSYVVVPVTVRGLSFGAFVFGTTGDMRGFRPSDQSAAEELGRRAALAVEASLLYREAHDSAELAESYSTRLRNLLNAWLSISVALERPDGLRIAADGARRVLDGAQAHLWIDGMIVTAVPEGRPAPAADFWETVRAIGAPARENDWISAPLRDPSARVDGVLLVTGKTFDAEDESLLLLLAQMIAAALANASLHRATRENEARLSALIDSSPVAIVDLSLDTSIRAWNPAAARLFDWPADSSSGWAAAFESPLHEWVSTLAAEAIADATSAQMECEYTRDDGQEKALVLAVSPVHDQFGAVTGLLLVADDETERRQLTRQFHEAQRLEAVGRMAGGVAHDFNNLLTVILGYADGMLRRLPEGDPQRERIAAISRAGHRGAALTRQLLAVSRRQVVAPIVLRPVDVFNELAGMVGRLIGEDIHVHVPPSEDDRPIRIDKAQFEQCVLNLAANARDAMKSGGDLYLEVVQWPTDPQSVAVQVRDTGVGMDEDTLAHCLEPFYTTKDRGEGTGLGMAAVYGIVTQSGGDMVVRSTVGVGTTVTLLLPAVDAPLDYAPAVELPTPDSAPVQQSGTLLLVEDESELRSMVRRMLRERGYVVLQASSGAQAVAMLQEYDGPLDLVITDVVMPGMKGPELARRVAMERDVPVLFVSGYAEELVDMPELDAPTAFLAKPFTPEQLLDQVHKMLAVSRTRRPIADSQASKPADPQWSARADAETHRP